jgi:protein TonB
MSEERLNKLVGLFFVIAIHGALLYTAISYRLIAPPQEAVTLFVDLINPPLKKLQPPPELPKLLPKKVILDKPRQIEQPKPAPVLVVETPEISATDPVAPQAPPEPVKETPSVPEPVIVVSEPIAPVMMSSELSLACPERTPPNYPAISRRAGEQGQVKLRVELDETGKITSVRVAESSGHKRLDDAGLAAIKNWHCNAAARDGKPVRAIALQPFDFILEGR